MIISLIAAIGRRNQLGLNGGIPWKLKADLRNFKNLTLGHSVLMGRKTFQSIGKPLVGRTNLIMSRKNGDEILNYDDKNCNLFSTLEEAIAFAKNKKENELFIIGGATIYELFMVNNLVDRLYLTEVDYDGEADTFFPIFDKDRWKTIEEIPFEKTEGDDTMGKLIIMDRMTGE